MLATKLNLAEAIMSVIYDLSNKPLPSKKSHPEAVQKVLQERLDKVIRPCIPLVEN